MALLAVFYFVFFAMRPPSNCTVHLRRRQERLPFNIVIAWRRLGVRLPAVIRGTSYMANLLDAKRSRLRMATAPLGLTASLFIGGCTPAATVVALAANGVSYAATGKGTTDHLISEATDSDCSLDRGLGDEPVCRDNAPDQILGETMQADATFASVSTAAPPAPKAMATPAPTAGFSVLQIMNLHTRAFLKGNQA